MAHVILVHGLAATDKSWFSIPDALTAAGHTVVNVELPNGLEDGLDTYVAAIEGAFPATGKCVLIGHSMGGISISQTAATHPGRVAKLVYVTALVPADGESAAGIMAFLGTSVTEINRVFRLLDIDDNDPARRDPSFGAIFGRFESSGAFDTIPKHYVRCSNDTVVKPRKQTEMISKWPVMTESTVTSNHIPQKEAPDDLAAALLAAID